MKRRHSMDSSENRFVKRQQKEPSLFILNDDCLLEVYKYLGLDDSISLSRTCQRLNYIAKLFNKKYSEFKINVNVDNKRTDYVEYVITNMNDNITEISIDYQNSKIPMNVKKMSECCRNVKDLEITNWKLYVIDSYYHLLDNIETLTMINCDFLSADNFCEIFNNLKVVCLYRFRNLTNRFVERMFRKNPDIETFVGIGNEEAFDAFELFLLVPKLKILSLSVDSELNNLHLESQFNNLTKLQLFCNGNNCSEFLHQLGKASKNPKLKELELLNVRVDDLFFYALFYFQQLELLAISTWSYWELKPPIDLPQKIKHLRLESFVITLDGFVWTLKQLEHIQHVDITRCTIAKKDQVHFRDLERATQVISGALTDSGERVDFYLFTGRRSYNNDHVTLLNLLMNEFIKKLVCRYTSSTRDVSGFLMITMMAKKRINSELAFVFLALIFKMCLYYNLSV